MTLRHKEKISNPRLDHCEQHNSFTDWPSYCRFQMRPGSDQNRGKHVRCAANYHTGHGAHRWSQAVLLFAIVILIGASDMALAQRRASAKIAVTCFGSDKVLTETLTALCSDLQEALTEKYPAALFVASDGVPEDSAPVVMLEAFSASKAGIAARLRWRIDGTAIVNGPRFGFSISDKDMTPAMQLQFLNRLVHDTTLPF